MKINRYGKYTTNKQERRKKNVENRSIWGRRFTHSRFWWMHRLLQLCTISSMEKMSQATIWNVRFLQ